MDTWISEPYTIADLGTNDILVTIRRGDDVFVKMIASGAEMKVEQQVKRFLNGRTLRTTTVIEPLDAAIHRTGYKLILSK